MSNMPQSSSDLFDSLLPLGLDAYPERAKEIDAIFSFKVGEETWTLDCKSAPPKIHKGEGPTPAQCTIELSEDDFKLLITDHNKGIDLYFKNRIRVTGEANLCLKLGVFFEITSPSPG